MALDGRAGLHQYSDEAVRRPTARHSCSGSRLRPRSTAPEGKPDSRVTLKLKNGEELEETVSQSHGTPEDPLSDAEILGKFHECSEAATSPAQRERLLDLCRRLDTLGDVGEFGEAMKTSGA